MSLQDEVLTVFREERRRGRGHTRLYTCQVRSRVIAKRKAAATRILGFYWITCPSHTEVRNVIHELMETHPKLVPAGTERPRETATGDFAFSH